MTDADYDLLDAFYAETAKNHTYIPFSERRISAEDNPDHDDELFGPTDPNVIEALGRDPREEATREELEREQEHYDNGTEPGKADAAEADKG